MRKGPMGRRGRLKAKSGTCNVCSAPCSSCMHHNLGFMGSMSDESSDDACHRPVASQYSMNEDDVLPLSRVKAPTRSIYTVSEASNLVSVNSKFDSSSENDDLGQSNVSNKDWSSKDIGIHGKISPAAIGSANHRNSEVNVDLGRSNVSNKDWRSKCDEDHGESQGVDDVQRSEYAPIGGEINQKCGSESSEAGDHSAVHYSDQNDSNDKSGKRAQTHETEDLKSPAKLEDESDDVELLEYDVKVCDICGDAGREDSLAICCRCSDGAEHTYCMRKMLKKVPEGEWLCEECKFELEAEKQKQDARVKREIKALSVSQSFRKRHVENLEAAPVTKRQAIDTNLGSPKAAISRADNLSRNSSFKCTDKVTKKLAHQTSFDRHHNENVEKVLSTGSQLQRPKGTLFKSKSFSTVNLKPKVKVVDDDVLPRQKGVKEYTSHDMKDSCSRTIRKSMSFKSRNVRSSCGSDTKVKTVPSKFSHPQEVLWMKQAKERSRFEKKDLSKSDCFVGRSKTASSNVSTSKVDKRLDLRDSDSQLNENKSRELKGLQSDCQSSFLRKQASGLTRNHVETPAISAKASSRNRTGGSTGQTLNQSIIKDEHPSTSSESAEGNSGYNDGPQDIVSRLRESRNLGQNTREAVVNRPRSALLRVSKGIPAEKDTADQGCTGEAAASELDSSSTKYSRDEIGKDNRLRVAVDAALRKKPTFVKTRGRDQSDPSVPNSELSSDKNFESRLPVSNAGRNPIFVQERKGLPNFHASDSFKQTTAISGQNLAFPSKDARPVLREWPLAAISIVSETLVVPEHEVIWKGHLEVQRHRNPPELHRGIQAHLSNFAAPKVVEVAHKLPERIYLNEVQRLTIWPAQFHENGAKEDHIALFFFAEDTESYEKNYKPLVDNMMKKDLALKGNLDNVELLIFASNQLPQNCQRWNMLFFLWGVFKGRKESLSNLPKSTCIPGLNVLAQNRSLPHFLPQNRSSFKHVQKESAVYESLCNTVVSLEEVITADKDHRNKDSMTELSSVRSEAYSKHPRFSAKLESSSRCPKEEPRTLIVGGPKTAKNSSRELQSFENQDIGTRIRVKDENVQAGEDPVAFLRNDEVCSTGRESNQAKDPSRDQGNHRKRPYLELAESKDSLAKKDKVPLTVLNSVFADESFNKKARTDPDGDNIGIVAVNRHPASDDERSIQKHRKQSERFIFPVDLNQGCEEEQLNVGVSNLELGVPADNLSLFAGTDDGEGDGRNNGDREKEDDVATALSLSLSFPLSNKVPVSKTEPRTRRPNVNTSLLLFSGLADK